MIVIMGFFLKQTQDVVLYNNYISIFCVFHLFSFRPFAKIEDVNKDISTSSMANCLDWLPIGPTWKKRFSLEEMKMKKIVVYSKPNCMQCQFTKKFLEDRGIPYESKDVQSSDQALNEVKDMGYTSLPVVLADGLGSFNGFRPDMLSKLA